MWVITKGIRAAVDKVLAEPPLAVEGPSFHAFHNKLCRVSMGARSRDRSHRRHTGPHQRNHHRRVCQDCGQDRRESGREARRYLEELMRLS
jgi:hypothetical protein